MTDNPMDSWRRANRLAERGAEIERQCDGALRRACEREAIMFSYGHFQAEVTPFGHLILRRGDAELTITCWELDAFKVALACAEAYHAAELKDRTVDLIV